MPDLAEMFRLDENAVELFIRTTVIYLGLVVAMRIIGRREVGSLELTDLLMIVLDRGRCAKRYGGRLHVDQRGSRSSPPRSSAGTTSYRG